MNHDDKWKRQAVRKYRIYHNPQLFEAFLLSHFREFLREVGNWTLYPPQQEVADRIIISIFRGDIADIFVQFARQSGKTTTMGWIVSYITFYFPKFYRESMNFPHSPISLSLCRFSRGCWSGIFAPSLDQADIAYAATRHICNRIIKGENLDMVIDRSDRIEFPDGSTISKYSTSSKYLEGRALHLIYVDETQDVTDDIIHKSIGPMGTHTRASTVYSGTMSLQLGDCRYFYESLTQGEVEEDNLFIYDGLEFCKHSEDYKLTFEKQKKKLGQNNILFTGPYMLQWNESAISFTSKPALMRLAREEKRITRLIRGSDRVLYDNIYAGIDVAKSPDSTVVTIMQVVKTKDSYELKILNWFEPQLIRECTNYEIQADMIMNFISNYSLRAIAVDSQKEKDMQGDAFFDMLKGRFNVFWPRTHHYSIHRPHLIPHKWNAYNHSDMMGQLHTEWHQGRVSWPDDQSREAEKFKSEMITLGYEYRNNLLRCHHPDGKHDDYPSSLCICIRAIGLDYFNPNAIAESPKRGILSFSDVGTRLPGEDYGFMDDEVYDMIRT